MDSGQNQMAGQSRLDGDFRGFQIADFSNHDNVRVLADDRAQALGESVIFTGLGLVNSGQLIFNRVLNGYNLGLLII